jgi:hypothetical protein
MLGLIGVGAGILFSSYSQTLKTNIQMTNSLAVKSDMDAAATTLAATSVLGSSDPGTLCPPQGGGASSDCAAAPEKMVDFYPSANVTAGDVHLPASYLTASAAGAPAEAGIFTPAAGVKQIDPWGHYYIYCRWESAANSTTNPAIEIISAGPDGKLQTSCGATSAVGDDIIVSMNAANAVNRSAVWQTGTIGSSTPDVYYGTVGHQLSIDANGNMTVPGNITVQGSYSSPNGNIGLTNGLVSGNFQGGTVAGTTGAFTSDLSADNGTFATGVGGTLTAASGGFIVGTGGSLSAAGGFLTLDSSNGLTVGSSAFSVAASGNTSVGGDLAVTGPATLGSSLMTIGAVNIGTQLPPTGTPLPILSVGKKVGLNYPFSVDQAGNVTASSFNGTLNGSVNGGTISGSTVTATTSVTTPAITASGGLVTLTGNLTVSGAVTASSFLGDMTIGTGGVSLYGVLPIANGGTGGSTASDALSYLGVTSGGYLNPALLSANLIPGADLVNQSVGTSQLSPTGVGAGTYNSVVVTADGRVVSGTYTPPTPPNTLTDGSGDMIVASSSGLAITLGSSAEGVWNSTGLMIGTSTVPRDRLDVYGATAIGTSYAGIDTAPTNGLIVVGSVGVGTSNPTSALSVNGTVTAGSFTGDGSGLTGIGTASITGTLGTGNGGTGTNTAFTQGSVVFAGASGVYSQDNANFFYDATDHRLGIGSSSPTQALSVAGNVQIENGSAFMTKDGSGRNMPIAAASGNDLYLGGTYDNNLYLGVNGRSQALTIATNGTVGIGTASPAVSLDLSANSDALALPVGNTLARPSGANAINGEIRYNSSTPGVEVLINGNWSNLLATGSGAGEVGVSQGGTGDTTLTAHAVLVGEGTSPVSTAGPGDQYTVLAGTGLNSDPAFTTTPTLNSLTLNNQQNFVFASDWLTAGTQSDVNFGSTSAVRYSGGSPATFYGIAAGTAGQILYLHNASLSTLTLSNQSNLDNTATSRIITGTASDLLMLANSSVTLQYDGLAARWRIVGGSGGGIPAGTTGQIQFNSGANTFAADPGLTWDNTDKYLGIGLGTVAPLYPLHVVGTMAGDKVHVNGQAGGTGSAGGAEGVDGYVQYDSNGVLAGSPNFFWDNASAELGIGTSTPAARLDVEGIADINVANNPALSLGGGTPQFQIGEGAGIAESIVRATNDSYGPHLVFQKTRGLNGTSLSAVQSGDSLGHIIWGGADGSAWQWAAQIQAKVNGTVGSGMVPTDLVFNTGATAYGSESMRITSVGSVGIGTAVPNSLLQLYGGEVQVGSSGNSCGSLTAGAISYASGVLSYCDGANTTWEPLESSASSIGTGQITGTLAVAQGGTGTSTAFTQGSVVFAGASGTYTQDNANFFYDVTDHWLGIGTATPGANLQVYDASNTTAFQVNQNGAGRVLSFGSGGLITNAAGTFGHGSWGTVGEIESYPAASLIGDYVRGASSQTADAFQYQNSSATTLAEITAAGGGYFAGNVGIGTANPANQLYIAGSIGGNGAIQGTIQNTNSAGRAAFFATNDSGNGAGFEAVGTGVGGLGLNNTAVYFGGGTNKFVFMPDGSIGDGGSSPIVFRLGGYNPDNDRIIFTSTGYVGIGTTTPTNIISLGGTAAQTIWMERNPTAAVAGNNLTVQAGGSISGGTNLNGGNLNLSSGISTGTGASGINFTIYKAGSSGAIDNTATTAMMIGTSGNVGIGTTSPASASVVQVYAGSASNVLERFTNTAISTGFDVGLNSAGNALLYDRDTTASIIFGTNNTERARISSAGLVGIGTSSPGSMLQVNGNAAIGYPTNTGGPSNGLAVSGNVGIGSAAPLASLDMSQKADALALPVGTNSGRPTGANLVNGEIRYNSAIPGLEAYINGGWSNILASAVGTSSVTGSGTTNYVARWLTGTSLGTGTLVDNGTSVGIGTTSPTDILQVAASTGSNLLKLSGAATSPELYYLNTASRLVSSGNVAYDMTLNNGGTIYNVLTFNNNGNVGIGTTSPASALNIYSSGTTNAITLTTINTSSVTTNDSITNTNGVLQFNNSYGNSYAFEVAGNPIVNMGGGVNGVAIGGTYASAGSPPANGLMVQGNVGIGTTSPSYNLDVTGTARVTGNFSVDTTDALLSVNASNFVTTIRRLVATEYATVGAINISTAGIYANVNYPLNLGVNSATYLTIAAGNQTDAGDIGIGTATPTSLLHTYEAAAKTAAYTGVLHDVFDTSSTASVNKVGMDIESTGTWTGTGAINTGLFVNASGGTTNYAAIFNGGNVGIGTTAPGALVSLGNNATNIKMAIFDNGSNVLYGMGALNSNLTFGAAIGVNGTPQMVLSSSGFVGIGTTSPTVSFDVIGQGQFGSATTGGVRIGINGGVGDVAGINNAQSAYNPLQFRTSANPTMYLDTSGNVGIGTTLPQTILNLGGNISAASWTSGGIDFSTSPATYTDTTSVGSSSITYRGANSFGTPTFASANAITVTDAATVMIAGAPIAGTNTTITNPLALEAFGNIKAFGIENFGSNAFFVGTSPSLTVGSNMISQYGMTLTTGNFSNTGLFLAGYYGVALYTGGNERIDISSLGNVGIGTAAATSLLQSYDSAVKTAAYTGVLHGVYDTSSTASVNKVGMDVESTGTWNGTSAINTGLVINATGGTTNYAATFNGGNVGIGTTSPGALLSLGQTITTIKEAVYDNGTSLYGIGVNNGELTFGAAIAATGTPQMVLTNTGNVGIGTTSPNVNAALQVYSTTKGFLPPQLNNAQETAMGTSLPTGLVVYNTQNNELESFNGTTWEAVGAAAADAGGTNAQLQYNNGGDLGGTAGMTWDSTNDALTLATIANPASSALTITGGALTGTTSYPALNVTQTWNNAAGTFTGILENVANTNSLPASKLLDLQLGGTSQFNVSESGILYTANGPGYIGSALTGSALLVGSTWQISNTGALSVFGGRATFGAFGNSAGIIGGQGGLLYDFGPGGINGLIVPSASYIGWSTNPATTAMDTMLTRQAAAVIHLGANDAAAPVAQTFGVQNVLAGTTNTAGVNFTINGSQGTGTGAGGNILFQTAPAGSTGTAQNTLATAMTIAGTGYVGIGTTSPTRTLDIAANVVHSGLGLTSQLSVRGASDSTQKLNLGYDTTSNYGFIEAIHEGAAWQPLILQPQPGGGNVGIGTTTPSATLYVNGGADAMTIQTANTGGNRFLDFAYGNNDSGNYGNFQIQSSTLVLQAGNFGGKLQLTPYNGGIYSSSLGLTVDALGNIGLGTTSPASLLQIYNSAAKTAAYTGALYDVFNTSSTASINKVGMDIESTGSWTGTSAVNTGLVVNSTGGTTNYAATFNGGNVGIGTTAPSIALHLYDVATGEVARFGDSGIGVSASQYITVNARGVFGYNAGTQNTVVAGGSSAHGIEFNIGNSFGSGTVMLLATSGNVGIGTTSPIEKLDVYGNVRLDNVASGLNAGFLAYNSANQHVFSFTRQDDVTNGSLSLSALGGIGFQVGKTSPNASANSALFITNSGNVGIGTTAPNANSILQLYSTTKGFLPPLLTTAQETTMGTSLPTGLVVYNTDVSHNELESWNGTSWEAVGAAAIDAGGTNTQLQYNNGGDLDGTAGMTWDNTNDALTLATIANPGTAELTLTGGTAQTTSQPVLSITQTWNNASTTFDAPIFENVTNTLSNTSSKIIDLQYNGVTVFGISPGTGVTTLSDGNILFGASTAAIKRFNGQTLGFGTAGISGAYAGSPGLGACSTCTIGFSSTANLQTVPTLDTILSRAAVATIHLGATDTAAPVAQTLGVQNVVAGTTNTAGQNFTITGSQGTGTGAGGSILFQTAPAGLTGTAQNGLATAMTVTGAGNVGIGTTSPTQALTVAGNIVLTPNVVNGTAYIGAGDGIHGALLNRQLSLDDGTYVKAAGGPFSSQSFAFTVGGGGYNFAVGSTSVMTIINSGNVGIGTTSPTSLLHTYEAAAKTAAYTGVLHNVLDTSSTASINKVGMDVESTGAWNGTSAVNTGLVVNAAGGTTNYAATFSGGNVGIGTTSPGSLLTLLGNNAITFTGVSAQNQPFTISTDATDSVYMNFGGGLGKPFNIQSNGSTVLQLNAATNGHNMTGKLTITPQSSSRGALAINAVASQAADLFDVTASGGSTGGLFNISGSGNVGIGTTSPNANAALQVYSTTKGFLPPQLNNAQETAMGTSLPTGLVVYNTQNNELESFNGTTWEAVGAAAADAGGTNAQLQYNNGGDLGGTSGLTWDSTNDALTLATIANPTASALTITGGTLTGTTSYPALNVTQTWNNAAGTFTSILENVTNTFSNPASKLMDLQVSGASKFSVTAVGNVGIGTTAPNRNLEVDSASGVSTVRISSAASTTAYTELQDSGANQGILSKYGASGATTDLDINPIANDGTSAAYIRMFRSTNTTGVKAFQLFDGNNTTTVDSQIGVAGQNTYFNTGNVGIGTTSPVKSLHVYNTTGAQQIAIDDSAGYSTFQQSNGLYINSGISGIDSASTIFRQGTGATESMRIASTGNIGIGTAVPTSLLHSYESTAKTAAYTGVLHDVFDTSSTASVNKVGMDVESTGTWNGTSAINTGLVVNATGGTTNYAATFFGGNVGIGTTAPGYLLDMQAVTGTANLESTTGTNHVYLNFNNTAGNMYVGEESSGGGSLTVGGLAYAGVINVVGANAFQIGTNNTARLTINSSGNVGIGTTLPLSPLNIVSTSTIATGAQENGVAITKSYTIADAGNKNGMSVQTIGSLASGSLSTGLNGILSLAGSNGTNAGSISNAAAYWGRVDNNGGTVSNAYGFLMQDSAGTSAPVNQYGVYIPNLAKGSTSNFAIYTAGATPSYFGGNVGIGTTSPGYTLQVNGSVAGASAYNNLSDMRLKTDIEPIAYGLSTIEQMRPVGFNWKKQDQDWQKQHQIGLIAQEVEKIVPEVVTTAKDEIQTKSIAYGSLVPILIKAVQELKELFDGDHGLLAKLEAMFASDHDEITQLKAANDNQVKAIKEMRDLVMKQQQEFETYKKAHP